MTSSVPRGVPGLSGAYRPFRRRVVLGRPAPGVLEAELEDHIHHVAVTIGHRDGRVRSIDGRGIRLPWSLCSGASAQLEELLGAELGTSPVVDDMSAHCTHLLDLASTTVRFAGTEAPSRCYDVTVADWDTPVATARVRRDDGLELVLQTDGQTILAPEVHEGRSLRAGFTRWATESLDPDHTELALLARRAVWMRISPAVDLDAFAVLSESGVARGSCYASQPARIEVAVRNRGSSLRELPA